MQVLVSLPIGREMLTSRASRFHPNLRGDINAFVTKIDASGSALLYSTYLGGNDDGGRAIAVDSVGNAYVTGFTESSNFPTINAAQPTFGGIGDAFIAKFNPTG